MAKEQFSALLTVIVPMVVEAIVERTGMDELTATKAFYASRVYAELSEEDRKLWHYSALVLSDMYVEERDTGRITYPEEAF